MLSFKLINNGSNPNFFLIDIKAEKKNITAHDGKYGPYVKCGKINASLLGDQTIDSLNLDDAV